MYRINYRINVSEMHDIWGFQREIQCMIWPPGVHGGDVSWGLVLLTYSIPLGMGCRMSLCLPSLMRFWDRYMASGTGAPGAVSYWQHFVSGYRPGHESWIGSSSQTCLSHICFSINPTKISTFNYGCLFQEYNWSVLETGVEKCWVWSCRARVISKATSNVN
jgi:hypothetical protein